jgi:hypothetical protein
MTRLAFRQAEVLIKQKYPNAWFVYDGLAIAYSMSDIEDQTFTIIAEKSKDIEIPPLPADSGSGGRGGRGGGRGGRGGRGGIPIRLLN